MFGISDEDSPVFVQLIANGLIRNLALPSNEERALVVGSTAGAAFQLTGPGVAPVQFHIERAEGAVWLIPAYRIEDLRLNSAAVLGPTPLEGYDVIEFAGVRLEMTIRDAASFVASGDSLYEDNRGFGASYSMALPGEADTTQLAMDPLANSSPPHGQCPTNEARPVCLQGAMASGHATMLERKLYAPLSSRSNLAPPPLALHRHSSQQSGDSTPDFTLLGTQIIRPYRPPADPIAQVGEPPLRETRALEPHFVQGERRVAETLRLDPLSDSPRPQPVSARRTTTKPPKPPRAGVSARETTVTPPPLGRHPLAVLAEEKEEPSLHWQPTRKDARAASKPSLLTRLGLLTKARPLLVGCFTGVGAALLTILLVAATRVMAPRPAQLAAPQTSVFVAELNSLRPAAIAPAPVPALASASSVVTDAPQSEVFAQPSVSAQAIRHGGARKASAAAPHSKSLY